MSANVVVDTSNVKYDSEPWFGLDTIMRLLQEWERKESSRMEVCVHTERVQRVLER